MGGNVVPGHLASTHVVMARATGLDHYRFVVFKDPAWDFRSFDYDHDVNRAMAYGHDALDVPVNGLQHFFAGKRKLLLTHGWADGLIPAQSTVNFYEALVKDAGARRAKDGAKTPYALPGTKAMQERGWDDCATGLDTLLSGGTAEAAVEAYLQEMSKYTTA